ncbi:MAG: hypothetical protein IKI58_08685 [Oscillospiraceae bacterium]|nr:hypothetical protein [Oscillospiraceae bacterium]
MNTQTTPKNRSIYIVVTRTGTNVARAIRMFSRMPYSHVSLSGDASLHLLYSFCRNYKPIPLPATFNTEMIGEGTLGKFDQIPCEVYEIRVTDEQYARFWDIIEHFCDHRKQYSYSIIGLLLVKLQIKRNLEKKFVCSQFVAHVLKECGVELDKAPCLYSPDDLRYLPGAKLIYRGELNRYYHDLNENEHTEPLAIHPAV